MAGHFNFNSTNEYRESDVLIAVNDRFGRASKSGLGFAETAFWCVKAAQAAGGRSAPLLDRFTLSLF